MVVDASYFVSDVLVVLNLDQGWQTEDEFYESEPEEELGHSFVLNKQDPDSLKRNDIICYENYELQKQPIEFSIKQVFHQQSC